MQSLGTAGGAGVGHGAGGAEPARASRVEELSRGDALLTPGAFRRTALLDVTSPRAGRARCPPRRSCTSARRPSGHGCGPWTARCSGCGWRRRCRCGSATGCCCAIPGARRVLGADVRDVDPPELRRRGRRPAAGRRAGGPGRRERRGRGGPRPPPGGARRRLRRHGLAGARRRDGARAVAAGAPAWSTGWPARLPAPWPRTGTAHPLEPGPPAEVVRRVLDLPGRRTAGRRGPARRWSCGRGGWSTAAAGLPAAVQRAVDGVRARLAADPFAAPEAGDLAAAGLGRAGTGGGGAERAAGAGRGRRSTWRRGSRRRRGRGWPTSRSRSPSARHGRPGEPAAGSPCRSWSGSTPAASPPAARQQPPPVLRGPTTKVQLNRHWWGCVMGGSGGPSGSEVCHGVVRILRCVDRGPAGRCGARRRRPGRPVDAADHRVGLRRRVGVAGGAQRHDPPSRGNGDRRRGTSPSTASSWGAATPAAGSGSTAPATPDRRLHGRRQRRVGHPAGRDVVRLHGRHPATAAVRPGRAGSARAG